VLSGNASLQLYYIVLILQFYLLLPAFLWLLRRTKQHPWRLVSVSFVLQMILWTVDYYTLEAHSPSSTFWAFVAYYHPHFVVFYQFFFVLGGVVALHLSTWRAWVLAHWRWVLVAFAVTLIARTLVFVFEFDVAHLPLGYTTEALQPVMVFYSVGVIAFLYWLAYRFVLKHPNWQHFWHTLSDASFGVFLVHPVIMGLVFLWVIFPLRSRVPGLVCVALTWLLTVLGSAVWSTLFMRLPVLSHVVGRSRRMPDHMLLVSRLKRRAAHPRVNQSEVRRFCFISSFNVFPAQG
jgi:peptidoglycan/LPS O-acetylase OafA/YrhL